MQDVSSAKSLLQQAVSHHRAGALAQAESRYRQVLALDERQPDATHNLGAVLAQQGKLSDALPFLLRALDLEAGRRAGMRTILFAPGILPEFANQADLIVQTYHSAADQIRKAFLTGPRQ